ncbi:MAG: hypothetical protein KatS3mg002_0234 [Candidatus Woesearchaeota archaeon]|nr:MAG: hypothetical protein KatS3mg002_0234 [Candidatus Woesearchaeota archaeon]
MFKKFLYFLFGGIIGFVIAFSLLIHKFNTIKYEYIKIPELKLKESHIPIEVQNLIENQILDREITIAYIMYENYKITKEEAIEIYDSIILASRIFNINPIIILGLIQTESDFDIKARSNLGAIGLMQINPKVWVWGNIEFPNLRDIGFVEASADLYDIKTNILCGTYILSKYIETGKRLGKENYLEYALTRYFGGQENQHFYKVINSCKRYFKFTFTG